jgi:DNA-binding CsgD family transcriptional regulator/predicted negative regulator of RcsB-dependent stress response
MSLVSRVAFPDTWPEQVVLAESFTNSSRVDVSPRLLGNLLMYCGLVFLAEGRRDRFDEIWRESITAHARGYPAGAYIIQPGKEALIALLEGRLDDAIRLGKQGGQRGDEVGRPVMGRILPYWLMFASWLYLDQPEGALEVVQDFVRAAGVVHPDTLTQLMLAVAYSRMGQHDEAKTLVASLGDGSVHELLIAELALRLQLAVVWNEHDAAVEIAERLTPVAHLAMVNGFTPCIARLIGQRWLMDQDVDRARAAFELAVRVCERMRCLPELALSRLDLVETLLGHYPQERRNALELLHSIKADVRAMNMQPALDRAVRLEQSVATANGLTRREQEVAILVAAGHSNREVAEKLVISEATVEVHVKHILSKLGFRSRAQVAAWAAQRGLTASVGPSS